MTLEQGPKIEDSNIKAAMRAHTEMQARLTDSPFKGYLDGMGIGASETGSWYVGIKFVGELTMNQVASLSSLSEGVGAPVKFYGPDGRSVFPPEVEGLGPRKRLVLPVQGTPGRVE